MVESLRQDIARPVRLARLLAEQRRLLEAPAEHLAFRDVPARLTALPLRLANRFGEPVAGGILLDFSLGHQELADHIASSGETTTVALNAFRRQGLLTIARRRILLRDPAGLQPLA